MNLETMRLLVAKGLTAADILEIAETMDRPPEKSAGAIRQARYRARKRGETEGVTSDVTRDGNSVTDAPLSPSPLPSPQTPQPTPRPHTPVCNTPRARGDDPFPRPDWADPQVWRDLKANRKAKRLSCTATAHTKLLRDIEALADDEWPPGRLLEAIVAKGWGAAYDPREKSNGNGNGRQENRGLHPNRDNRDGVAKALDRRLGLDGSAGETGRGNAGGGEGYRQLPAPAASAVR